MKSASVLLLAAVAAGGAFLFFGKDANATPGRGPQALPKGWTPPGDSEVSHPSLPGVGPLTKLTWREPGNAGGVQPGTIELVFLPNELTTFAATITPDSTGQPAPMSNGSTPLSITLLQGLVAGVI